MSVYLYSNTDLRTKYQKYLQEVIRRPPSDAIDNAEWLAALFNNTIEHKVAPATFEAQFSTVTINVTSLQKVVPTPLTSPATPFMIGNVDCSDLMPDRWVMEPNHWTFPGFQFYRDTSESWQPVYHCASSSRQYMPSGERRLLVAAGPAVPKSLLTTLDNLQRVAWHVGA